MDRIAEELKQLGFKFITMDLEGYRTGRKPLRRRLIADSKRIRVRFINYNAVILLGGTL